LERPPADAYEEGRQISTRKMTRDIGDERAEMCKVGHH